MNSKIKYIFIVILIVFIICCYQWLIIPNQVDNIFLSPPSWSNLFGTDIIGNDIFLRIVEASGYELITLLLVFFIIWSFGLTFGTLFYWIILKSCREFILNFIYYISTLPVLLISLFLLIIFGSGFYNTVIILSISLIPTQALFILNQADSAVKEDFILSKKSYGLSSFSIYKNHIIPFIIQKYNNYTFSRLPEVIMMNLALNFLGLGIQEPKPSLGRMLFDGLAFMFSAWWTWVFVVGFIIFLFMLLSILSNVVFYEKNTKF